MLQAIRLAVVLMSGQVLPTCPKVGIIKGRVSAAVRYQVYPLSLAAEIIGGVVQPRLQPDPLPDIYQEQLELSTGLHEVSQCLEKASTWASSLLKGPTPTRTFN